MIAEIDLDGGTVRYRPGESVSGAVKWSFPAVPNGAALCLRWRAEGKGTPDAGSPIAVQFEDALATDRRAFRLVLPIMPYSFSGKMLSIVWRVELVVRHRRFRPEKIEVFRVITMSPTGDPIDPYRR
jgi:hypothetical protein